MIERCPWAEARPALGDTLDPGRAQIDEAVERGAAHAWRLDGGGGVVYLLTRVERGPYGPELVIMAARGKGLDRAIGEVQRRARTQGCASIRFHTHRGPAFGRLAARYGFHEVERVHRCDLEART